MIGATLVIIIHQIIFQGMFFARNISLNRRLGISIRGKNREARLAIAYFALFILSSVLLSIFDSPVGTAKLLSDNTAFAISIALLIVNLLISGASLMQLGNSWRVGIVEDQQTDLIEDGIYRFSSNPYFLSYLILFVAYTVLMQSLILLVLGLIGFAMIHAMVLREEKHLAALHGEAYRQYKSKTPRYIIL